MSPADFLRACLHSLGHLRRVRPADPYTVQLIPRRVIMSSSSSLSDGATGAQLARSPLSNHLVANKSGSCDHAICTTYLCSFAMLWNPRLKWSPLHLNRWELNVPARDSILRVNEFSVCEPL